MLTLLKVNQPCRLKINKIIIYTLKLTLKPTAWMLYDIQSQ